MNLAAYPLVGSLLANVAKDIYGLGQTGSGRPIACFAGGALTGSIVISTHGAGIRPARTTLVSAVLGSPSISFSPDRDAASGDRPVCVGFRTKLLHDPHGGVVVARSRSGLPRPRHGRSDVAVDGMAIGLLAAGPLVEHAGFAVTGTIFSLVGIVFTVAVGVYWRRHLWDVGADANAR